MSKISNKIKTSLDYHKDRYTEASSDQEKFIHAVAITDLIISGALKVEPATGNFTYMPANKCSNDCLVCNKKIIATNAKKMIIGEPCFFRTYPAQEQYHEQCAPEDVKKNCFSYTWRAKNNPKPTAITEDDEQ